MEVDYFVYFCADIRQQRAESLRTASIAFEPRLNFGKGLAVSTTVANGLSSDRGKTNRKSKEEPSR